MKYTLKSIRTLATTLITIGSLSGVANAAAYYTFTEENGGVVLRSSGTLDLTGFIFSNDGTFPQFVDIYDNWIHPIVSGPADSGAGYAPLSSGFGWYISVYRPGVIESGDTFVTVWADGDPQAFIQSPTTLDNDSFDSSIISPNLVVRWHGHSFNSMGMNLIAPDTNKLIWKSSASAGDEGSIFLRISTIPEPSSCFLVGLGALLLTVRRGRV